MKELETNTQLSHYRIVSKIGEGGMGEVFLAEDTRLRRRVALKVLPEKIAPDADRLLRFERESFAASALNHPNILTIFEFGAVGETHFLVSEFVDGVSLRQRLNVDTVTLSESLEITIQIASALQAAHEAGIIHRDIKPDNLMLRADGYVKVLDFGLAKLAGPSPLAAALDSSEEATRKHLQTQVGIIMGTVAYMSPEQARGLEVDKRTDIWSLGCVLYEMLSSQQPFRGETIIDTLANIIHREPVSIVSLRQDANAELERIINRTLTKNRDERYQTANELLADMKLLQKHLEFKAELERSSAPSLRTEARTQVIRSATTEQSATRNSIAVLPFSNLSADPDNDYFCDGLAEELLGALTRIDDLRVAARSSAFSFKNRNTNVSEIGRTLSVNTVLEGSVRKSGDRVRISVQLVNVVDGYHLWSERYDRKMKDIFDVQDEITLSVVDALKLKLFGDEKEEVLKRYTQNAEAYQLYLRGRFFFNNRTPEFFKGTPEGFKKAIEYFQQAIQLDAEYALAYSGLADCYTFLGFYEHLAPAEAESKLKGPALKSLELDDTLAETRTSVALYKSLYQWDFVEADREHKRAIALNPKYAFAHHLASGTVLLLGRNNEAIAVEMCAIELEPFTVIFNATLAWWFYLAHRNEEAIAQSLRTIDIAPNHFFAYWVLGLAYGLAEKYDDAIAVLKKGLSLTSAQHIKADLARIYAQSGRREEALAGLSELRQEAKQQYVSAVNLAKIHLGLGDVKKVYEQLEQAFAERAVKLPWFMLDPMLDQLRAEPRFRDLWRRIGLPQIETAQRTPPGASEAHTVVFDSAENRIGKPASPGISGPNRSADSNSPADAESLGAEPIRNSAAASPDVSRPTSIVSGRGKSLLIIGLTISLVAIAVAAYLFFRNHLSEQIGSIAVLPFQNSSSDPDAEYLSDGLAESLIYRLSQLPNLKVSPTSSVMRYKGKQSDVYAIASELGVSAVMTGRIAQRGDNLAISVELVDVRNKQLLWGEQYARKISDLLITQREIATEIVQKLRLRISGNNENGLTKHYTENNDAYQLYLKGRFYWNRRTVEDNLKSLEYFHKAVEADPKFALAYVGISDARLMLGIPDAMAGAVSPAETLGPARAAAERALELDPTLAEAYASRGHVRWKEHDWTGAESDFKRSIELNPNYSYSRLFYSLFLTLNGRTEEGLNESKRSVELDPYSVPINSNLAVIYYLARRPDDAIVAGRRAVELDRGIPIGHQRLGWAYEQKGMFPEAIAEFQAAVNQSNHVPLAVASLAHAYALSGNKTDAKRLFAELEEKSKKQFISPYLLAIVQVALDQKQRAMELLEEAYIVNSIDLVQAKVDPKLDPLRDDPRFQKLMKKIGFPE